MSCYSNAEAKPFGKGQEAPAKSVSDPELSATVARYKRSVASRYRSLRPEEAAAELPQGTLYVSPKVDGELWYLVFEDGEAVLISPTGRVLFGAVPVLQEAKKVAAKRVAEGLTVLAGELFAARKKGRPRVGDLASAMGGEAKAEVGRIGYFAFDVVMGGDGDTQAGPDVGYPDRLALLTRLLKGGKRVQPVKTEQVKSGEAASKLFEQWAGGGKAEGIVARTTDERIYKVKPTLTVDAVVVGYTERTSASDQVGSFLLGLVREDGSYQLIGSCGNLGTDDVRQEFQKRFAPLETPSNFRHASSTGALYRMVRPEVVVEIRVTDLQAESPTSLPIMRMVLQHDGEGGWKAVRRMPGVSLYHPVLERVREDKQANDVDARMAQLLDRCLVPQVAEKVEIVDLPKSEVVRREVYVKETKGKKAVRKLVVWKTGKEETDTAFPAFVVHWTDYSSGRKDPLKREVRLAPSEDAATQIAEDMVTAGVKRGWVRADE